MDNDSKRGHPHLISIFPHHKSVSLIHARDLILFSVCVCVRVRVRVCVCVCVCGTLLQRVNSDFACCLSKQQKNKFSTPMFQATGG